MKLSVSNIAWGPEDFEGFLKLLDSLGCEGVEVAPSLLWDEPVSASLTQRTAFRSMVQDYGMEIVGLHSLYYGRSDLRLFDDVASRERMIDYTRELMHLCRDLGGETLVFGSPSNRRRGDLPMKEAEDIALEFMTKVAATAEECGVFLCIEPLSPEETDFISSSLQGLRIVKQVDHPNVRLNLDAKAMILSRENYESTLGFCAEYLKHFHVGDPGLAPPGRSCNDHEMIGEGLRGSGYDGFVSIEMLRNFGIPAVVITQSVGFVRRCYFWPEGEGLNHPLSDRTSIRTNGGY